MRQQEDIFEGFVGPEENWSKLPHTLINELHKINSLSELKVILYVLRHTWGYGDDEKKITIDEFAQGRKRKDGRRIDNGIGMSEPAIRAGIRQAVVDGFLIVETDDSDKGRIKNYYSLKIRGKEVGTQGENFLPPTPKKLSPRGKKVDPRTEKETSEKNLGIQTGDDEKDYLGDLLTHRTGKETVAEPDDFQKHFGGYRDPVLKSYNDEFGLAPNQGRKQALIDLANEANFDLELWLEYLPAYNRIGGNPYNIELIREGYWRYVGGAPIRQAVYPDSGKKAEEGNIVERNGKTVLVVN